MPPAPARRLMAWRDREVRHVAAGKAAREAAVRREVAGEIAEAILASEPTDAMCPGDQPPCEACLRPRLAREHAAIAREIGGAQ